MKKIPKKLIIINEPLFKSAVNVFLNYSFEDANKYLKKNGYDELPEEFHTNEAACFQQVSKKTHYYSIILPTFKWSMRGQATLAHELSHFCYMQLKEKGIDERGMNEVFSYMLEYYLLESLRAIGKLY